jgi:hypothetical protein
MMTQNTTKREGLRAFLLRNRMCVVCGLVDMAGGIGLTSLAAYWYCAPHLARRLGCAEVAS